MNYQRAKRYPQAIGHYLAVLRLEPRHVKALYNLGRAYEGTDQLDPAIRHYKALVKLEAKAIKAYYRLGEIYHIQGSLQEMVDAWTTVLRLNPQHHDAKRIRQLLVPTH